MSTSRTTFVTAAMAAALTLFGASGYASEKGDVVVRAGLAIVAPTGDSTNIRLGGADTGTSLQPDNDLSLGLTGTYMLTDTFGLGLLASYPFTHDIRTKGGTLAGLGDVAETKHLPPTLTLQYHPKMTDSDVQPYLGIGVNYTYFFDEDITDPTLQSLGVTGLDLDDSWGLALEAGMDIEINKNWFLNTSLWYINLNTTAKFQGPGSSAVQNAEVDIDPLVGMIGLAYKF